MSSKSKSQFRLFQMLKYNPKMRKQKGISKEVANEFASSGDKSYSDLPEKKKRKFKSLRD